MWETAQERAVNNEFCKLTLEFNQLARPGFELNDLEAIEKTDSDEGCPNAKSIQVEDLISTFVIQNIFSSQCYQYLRYTFR